MHFCMAAHNSKFPFQKLQEKVTLSIQMLMTMPKRIICSSVKMNMCNSNNNGNKFLWLFCYQKALMLRKEMIWTGKIECVQSCMTVYVKPERGHSVIDTHLLSMFCTKYVLNYLKFCSGTFFAECIYFFLKQVIRCSYIASLPDYSISC